MEEKEELNLYSEEVKDVLSKPPRIIFRWGNTMLFTFIGVILFLSWLIKYPDVIASEATITTQIPPQKEFAKTTGTLDAILVKDHQYVTAKQPLAIIENTANYQDVFQLKSIIDTITISNSGFKFPMDSIPILFLGEIEAQYALFENSYVQYQLNKE